MICRNGWSRRSAAVLASVFCAGTFGFARMPEQTTKGADPREEDPPAERVYSGPQSGEALPPLPVLGVYDEDAGRELDFVERAEGKPLFLVFVHELTRPAVGLARLVTDYAADRAGDGLQAGIVWLDDDRSAAERYLRRARRSLSFRVPVGISLHGEEGPGAWGLNRKVALTIVAAEKGEVTANVALVQPSDTDAPEILEAIASLVGGEAPALEELRRRRDMRRRPDPRVVRLLRRLASPDLDTESVAETARRLEELAGSDRRLRADLGRTARRIARRDDFRKRTTPEARKRIVAWARRYGKPASGDREGSGVAASRWRELLGPVVRKDAEPEQVREAIEAVEAFVAEHPERQRDLGARCGRVVASRIFRDGGYGIPLARKQLREWAERFGGEE